MKKHLFILTTAILGFTDAVAFNGAASAGLFLF
jgi:hypothetical protein